MPSSPARKTKSVSKLAGTAVDNESVGDEPINEVRLCGRVSGAPRTLELPSGDEVVSWRLVVDRPPAARTPGARVDTIDCAAWTAAIRRRAERLNDGESVRVVGRLRRRFWRGAAGPASRHEVEVIRLEKVSARA